MPINTWNFFRSVSAGTDLKTWNADNPQVEDGRDGGNVGFDDDEIGQYEDEVNHMMRRLRLNMYRAEDEMFMMRKRQWRIEDEEFAKEQKRRKKEAHERRVKKNRERRLRKEAEDKKEEDKLLEGMTLQRDKDDQKKKQALLAQFLCPECGASLLPPEPIFQCEDGHMMCQACRHNETVKVCTECKGPLAGRNPAMENMAAIIFSHLATEDDEEPSAPNLEDIIEDA